MKSTEVPNHRRMYGIAKFDRSLVGARIISPCCPCRSTTAHTASLHLAGEVRMLRSRLNSDCSGSYTALLSDGRLRYSDLSSEVYMASLFERVAYDHKR